MPVPGGSLRELAACPLFTAQLLTVEDSMLVGSMESFTSLLVLDEACTLRFGEEEPLPLKKGSSVFLPAGMHVRIYADGKPATCLCSRV